MTSFTIVVRDEELQQREQWKIRYVLKKSHEKPAQWSALY